MKVVHVSTFERAGGAAIAASRLHEALRASGHDSTMLVRERAVDTTDPKAAAVVDDGCPDADDIALAATLYRIYGRLRAAGADGLLTGDFPTRQLSRHTVVREADVINVHWASGLLSSRDLGGIQELGAPIVWTLHDQAAFTGGCHYSGPCRGYERDCAACPQLRPEAMHVPSLVLRHKRGWLDPSRLVVVSPSRWLAGCARQSALLAAARIETIPNGVPVDLFQRPARSAARARFGLRERTIVLLAGAHRLDERRKGHHHLAAILARLASAPALQPLVADGDLVLATFGSGDVGSSALPVVSLGSLRGDDEVALAYRAADLFLLPTLEDNLPNTLLESIAAGTPVLAYATGGVPDVLDAGGCGRQVPTGDVDAFAAALVDLVGNPAERARLAERCQPFARAALDISVQARSYLGLYDQLLSLARTHRAPGAPSGSTDSRRRQSSTEAALLAAIVEPAPLASALVCELARDVESQQALIAGRGGEILALRSQLETTLDEFRVCRETLHDVQERLRATAAERDAAFARQSFARLSLLQRLRRLMTRVAILGSGDDARRIWEAVNASGAAQVVACIDHDARRQGRVLLSTRVQPPSWLSSHRWDVVAVSEPRLADGGVRATLETMDASRVLIVPTAVSDEQLAATVAARLPDPLGTLIGSAPPCGAFRIGIFGTGSAAMKMWEALVEIEEADIAWFADNDPARQGRSLLWLDVIAPAEIVNRPVDAVVIGSMSRDAIHAQLRALGIASSRILAPDASGRVDRIRHELAAAIGEAVAPAGAPR
jgi:glycosyltransferase involved in cell wall biosynthesis